jgi:hypothetical protein
LVCVRLTSDIMSGSTVVVGLRSLFIFGSLARNIAMDSQFRTQ